MMLQNEVDAGKDAPAANSTPSLEAYSVKSGSSLSEKAQKTSKWRDTFLSCKWWFLIAVLAITATVYITIRHFAGTEVVVDTVRRGDLVETIVASGHVESPNRVDIASQITGTVVSVAVREGETVRQGQPLIYLSADELTNTALQAQGAVAAAQAQIRQVRELSLPLALEAQHSAESSLLGAQKVYNRASVLLAKGFVTRAYFDDVKKNRDIARAQVETAKAQVRSARDGGSDFANANAALMQAQAGAAAATSRFAYTTILAPRDGILIARNVERGAVVTPGEALMILSPRSSTQIVLQIDERNLGKIAVGQTALISADAYPSQRFLATVTFINPGIDIARGSAIVKLSVPNPPTYLKEDMTVSVDIETERRNAVLVLPSGSVHDALSSKPWIMTVENDRAVRRNVRLGLHGNTQIEIINGSQLGVVAIPVASQIAVGTRVKAAAKSAAK